MSDPADYPKPPPRVSSGVVGLDTITRGGLFRGGIYIVVGSPGSGKTTLGNQACFHHVGQQGRAAYVTLLSETHGRMLAQMQSMSFFDGAAVGDSILYVNGFTALESGGLDGLLKLLRGTVREQRADLLVLDGMVTASVIAKSSIDYKKFINELQTWVGVVGCTVLFLTSAGPEARTEPEYTMVDGIVELSCRPFGLRSLRQLRVVKFRGSGYIEGAHAYVINDGGLTVWPRAEALLAQQAPATEVTGQLTTGVPGLDPMLGGGLEVGTGTLVLGACGAGKTSLGLHFLAAGAREGKRGLHFGFFENVPVLIGKANAIGLGFGELVDKGLIDLLWQPPAEGILDSLAYRLVLAVREREIKRVFIDGLLGFHEGAYPERLPGFFAVLLEELRLLGVTSVVTDETRDLFVQDLETPRVSAAFDNVILLRQTESARELRPIVSVLKTRNSRHDRTLHSLDFTDQGMVVGPKVSF